MAIITKLTVLTQSTSGVTSKFAIPNSLCRFSDINGSSESNEINGVDELGDNSEMNEHNVFRGKSFASLDMLRICYIIPAFRIKEVLQCHAAENERERKLKNIS
jgi:hypothetical protein